VTNTAPLYDNLGNHKHPITTREPAAQRYFDQGLILTYAFNHEEAIRSFEEAARLDPRCAMCFWGKAYALGPNINAPMAPEAVTPAYEALEQAQQLGSGASPAEQAYIEALAARYTARPDTDRAALDKAFAEAMREVMATYPDDTDAATIYAEALMNLTPWNYWTKAGSQLSSPRRSSWCSKRCWPRIPITLARTTTTFTPSKPLRIPSGLCPAPNVCRPLSPAPATWFTCPPTSTGGWGVTKMQWRLTNTRSTPTSATCRIGPRRVYIPSPTTRTTSTFYLLLQL
jgi:hypothetical protein